MKYDYRGPGAPRGIPAEVTGSELTRIYEAHGELTASVIVEESRQPGAVLHTAFEWDDAVAAERHRESQARQLVRAVVIRPEPEKRETDLPMVRAFVSIHAPEDDNLLHRTYKPMVEVMKNPDELAQVKRRLLNDLLNLRARYLDVIEMDEQLNQTFANLVSGAN